MAGGCTSRVTWGQRGRRPSGHSRVWVNARLGVSQKESLHVHALMTAIIEERKEGHAVHSERACLGENKAAALCLWVTGNNHTLSVGPVAVDNAGKEEVASSLLYSDGSLHLLQGRGSVISLSRLTEELSALRSVLSTWTQKDIFFSKLSMPTAGLVAVLSDASSDDTWNDEYLCLNATVTHAAKDNDGLQVTGLESRAIWPVNTRGDKLRHVSLSHYFTLVASVTIEEAPNGNTPPLTAMLADTESNHTMGLSYTADNKWETMVKGKNTTKTEGSAWKPRKEHQLALMLQGNKASAYIDGKSLGKEKCR
ncbi:trans-sialidase [Trypanosoma cruzi]|nr:trans-sialidase [Trypanosoma cruzi]